MDENERQNDEPGPAAEPGPPIPPGPPAPPPPVPPAPPGADHLQDQLRGMRRSQGDRVLAGVCGGLARSLGVDPMLLRVVTAVLVLFEGTGLVLYAAAWLLLPVDDGAASVGAQALDRGRHRPGSRTLLLAVVLAVVVTFGALGLLQQWHGPVLLGLVALGVLLVLQRRTGTPVTASVGATHVHTVAGHPGASDPDPYRPAPSGASVQDLPPVPPAPAGTWAHASGTAPLTSPVPVAPRPRSRLFGLTFSSVVLGWGVLAAFDASGYEPQVGAYVALGLGLTGLGLLVGAWRGRARSLIVWGLLLTVLLVPATVVDTGRSVSGPSVSDTRVITRVQDLPVRDEFESGDVEYDLSSLDLNGQAATMEVRMGFGEIIVLVPRTADVRLDARAGLGDLDLFGTKTDGVKRHSVRTDVGPDGPGGGTLDLTLYAGFGQLEVRRATS